MAIPAAADSSYSKTGKAESIRHTAKPERSSVDLGCTGTYWAFFHNEWQLYKRKVKFPESPAEELRA